MSDSQFDEYTFRSDFPVLVAEARRLRQMGQVPSGHPDARKPVGWGEHPHDFNKCRCDQWGRCLVHCPTCTCLVTVD